MDLRIHIRIDSLIRTELRPELRDRMVSRPVTDAAAPKIPKSTVASTRTLVRTARPAELRTARWDGKTGQG